MRLSKSTLCLPIGRVLGSIGLAIALLSGAATAENFYRWVDDAGVVHYGSMPPQGVDAVKIKASGASGKTSRERTADKNGAIVPETDAPNLADLPPEEIERRRKVDERMKQDCESEKTRLEALNKPGRIRMQGEDGSHHFLSQNEIFTEIQSTKQRIKETCQ